MATGRARITTGLLSCPRDADLHALASRVHMALDDLESARQSAEDWLECIEVLRESGAVEAANLEYEAFILEYPVASAETQPNR